MDIQKQIDLENIRFDSIAPLFKDLEKPGPRKKISLLAYWFLPKEKKEAIKQAIEKENNFYRWQDIKKTHKEAIRKLELKKARYEIMFRKKEKPIEETVKNEPIFHYDHTAHISWLMHPIKAFRKTMWKWFDKETTLLINMELDNGKHISFIRKIEDNRFGIFGGNYIVDIKMCYYSLSAGMYCLDYHQSFSLPIKRSWDVDGIKTAIESSGIIDCPSATNPSNITRFLNSNIIEQIFQGASLGKMLMIIIIIGIITILSVVVCTFILNGKIAELMKAVGK